MRSPDPRVQRLIELFETLQPADLVKLGDFYAADAKFKDPFHEVCGVPAIRGVFEHMFVALDAPRFVVREAIVDGDQCFLAWDFIFRFKRFASDEQIVRGGSHLRFGASGHIGLLSSDGRSLLSPSNAALEGLLPRQMRESPSASLGQAPGLGSMTAAQPPSRCRSRRLSLPSH